MSGKTIKIKIKEIYEGMKRNINKETLTPVVRKVLNIEQNAEININSYKINKFKEGTQGEVYLIRGECLYLHNECEKKLNWDVVLKIQKKWNRFGDPESWKREFLMYYNEIFSNMPKNFRVPKCLEMKVENREVWLWLEFIKGISGSELTAEDYGVIAKVLGEYQGKQSREIGDKIHPWMSSRYWYSIILAMWGGDAVLYLDEEKNNAAYRELDFSTIDTLYDLWNNRDAVLDIMNKLPRTLCHRDCTPANVFISKKNNKESVIALIDWDCSGIGVLGEDIADLLGEALTFYEIELDKASELMDILYLNYIDGLREADCEIDKETVRLGHTMCFVLHWGFRVYCRLKDTEDKEMKDRYMNILRFVCQKAEEVKELVENLKIK